MIDDLNPPIISLRTIQDVQMELLGVINEIQSLGGRLDFLKSRELDLQNELRSLQTPITQRKQRDIDRERAYKEKFVMDEIFGDIFDV